MKNKHFSNREWRALCAFYAHICLCCHVVKPLVPDHIVPTAKGGVGTIDNIQPLCLACNARKHTDTTDYRTADSVSAFSVAFAAGFAGGLTMMELAKAPSFWASVDQSGGADACWPWIKAKTKHGYGAFAINGRQMKAHRFACELIHGPLAVGLEACHTCHTPACCNPKHVYGGTPTDRNRATVLRGRRNPTRKAKPPVKRVRAYRYRPSKKNGPGKARGEQVNTAKLTPDDVRAIRVAGANGESIRSIACRYQIVKETARLIIRREIWKHID